MTKLEELNAASAAYTDADEAYEAAARKVAACAVAYDAAYAAYRAELKKTKEQADD